MALLALNLINSCYYFFVTISGHPEECYGCRKTLRERICQEPKVGPVCKVIMSLPGLRVTSLVPYALFVETDSTENNMRVINPFHAYRDILSTLLLIRDF